MAFLRSVYMLNNYGDFINGDVRTVDQPYVQLLSTVDTSKMLDEFNAARNTQANPSAVADAVAASSILNANPSAAPENQSGVKASASATGLDGSTSTTASSTPTPDKNGADSLGHASATARVVVAMVGLTFLPAFIL
jgi:hypothetical protein